jgi:predicted ATPase
MNYKLLFEGIRCFASPQEVPVAPLTLLVGENSSGKTTFLALNRIAWDIAAKGNECSALVFNEDPFHLGAFAQIVNRTGEDKFTIEMLVEREGLEPRLIRSIWRDNEGQPYLLRLDVDNEAGVQRPFKFELSAGRPYAIAPTRSSPRRTYDPVSDSPDPEGSHVPMLLARLAASSKPEWTKLESELASFGRYSGLYDSIQVVRKGRKLSDPFQVNVKTRGSSTNVTDVGYGVSQVLPVIVDSIQARRRGATLLLQQPEVHLHPKAQAELGSFFAREVAKHKGRFIIETHSDYLIDRVRSEVRAGLLKPDDVSLLYFERKNNESQIHRLLLDKRGQILNAPNSYRQFFLDEDRKVLGIA